ncbi:uncharacterized protein LOC135461420 [Liolophura sinensis]|uniref:uncharacterized protein LOC135461420 n=1 Tax=Liolophura sinensis TaxID=3198878 RepID=UPI0031599548
MPRCSSGILKTVGAILIAGVATEIGYQLYLYFTHKRKDKTFPNDKRVFINKVLIFPDKSVACKKHFLTENGCGNENCRFSHEKSSLSELFQYLNSAKSSLDVCVFTISFEDLADILVAKAKAGVTVRVIADDEQVDVPGSQIWKLRAQGIALRTDNSSYFMHHKFVIIDNSLLINGSFNWTRQAIMGNQENLVIVNHPEILEEFKKEFSKLWEDFDPKFISNQPHLRAIHNYRH